MNENETKNGTEKTASGVTPEEVPAPAPTGATDPTEDPVGSAPARDGNAEAETDEIYRKQAEEDLAELRRLDPEASGYRHLGEMPGALRFAELRGLGLSVEEAYYAVRGSFGEKPSPDRGGRAHLHGSVPGRAAAGGIGMTVGEIEQARRLFPGLPDREIASLWRRVNEN